MSDPVHNEPGTCASAPGVVSEIKPDGKAVHMTPEAAIGTAAALLDAAAAAGGKKKLADAITARTTSNADQ